MGITYASNTITVPGGSQTDSSSMANLDADGTADASWFDSIAVTVQ